MKVMIGTVGNHRDLVLSMDLLRPGRGTSPLAPCAPPCFSWLSQVLEERTMLESIFSAWVDSWKPLHSKKKRTRKMDTPWPKMTCLPVHLCQLYTGTQSMQGWGHCGPGSWPQNQGHSSRRAGLGACAGWPTGLPQAALLSDTTPAQPWQ